VAEVPHTAGCLLMRLATCNVRAPWHWLISRGLDTLFGVLVVAGLLKASDLPHREPLLPQLQSYWLTIAAIVVDLALGLWLLLGTPPSTRSLVGALWFGVLAGVATTRLALGGADCGCFGQLRLPLGFLVILDVVASLSLAAIALHRGGYSKWAVSMFTPSFLIAPALAGIAMTLLYPHLRVRPDALPVAVSLPEPIVGQPLPFIQLIQAEADLSAGDWRILLYRSNCSACERILPDFLARAASARSFGDVRYAAIEVGTIATEAAMHDSQCVSGALNLEDFDLTTPTEFLVSDGIVLDLRTGRDLVPSFPSAEL